jgi:hypothetical protein
MTKDERQELRQIQETLITTLAKVTEMLGTPKTVAPVRYEDDSEAKERFIAP